MKLVLVSLPNFDMENLAPYSIDNLDINFQHKGDLLYHEGAFLSHFINLANIDEHYFYKWSDCDSSCNRWKIFRVSIENLLLFFEEKLTLLQLIEKNNFVYFVDLDTKLNQINAFVCPTKKIPEDYLPSENSFFKEKQYEKYAITLKKELEKNLKNRQEKQILETLLKEILTLKNNQVRQDLLLNSILNTINRKKTPFDKSK
jgi:hypothetical protein